MILLFYRYQLLSNFVVSVGDDDDDDDRSIENGDGQAKS